MVADIKSVETLTKRDRIRDAVRRDAMLIGIRPAARKHGIPERTALTWAHREKWKLPHCLATMRFSNKRATTQEALKANEIAVHTLGKLAEAIDEQGEHSRLYLSASTLQASHQLAQDAGQTKGERVPYAGLLNVARTGDCVHGWQAQRQQAPVVAVQVNMPTPEERAKLDAIDAQLDAITKRLTAPE